MLGVYLSGTGNTKHCILGDAVVEQCGYDRYAGAEVDE